MENQTVAEKIKSVNEYAHKMNVEHKDGTQFDKRALSVSLNSHLHYLISCCSNYSVSYMCVQYAGRCSIHQGI